MIVFEILLDRYLNGDETLNKLAQYQKENFGEKLEVPKQKPPHIPDDEIGIDNLNKFMSHACDIERSVKW